MPAQVVFHYIVSIKMCLSSINLTSSKKRKVALVDYIRQYVDPTFVNEQVPFPIHTESGNAGKVLCEFGQIEDKIYFLQSGIIHDLQTKKIIKYFNSAIQI
jgi:hypothetical protein